MAAVEDMLVTPSKSSCASSVYLLRPATTQSDAMLAAIPDLIFLLDADGRFLDVHAPRPEDLFAAPADFLGRRVEQVLPPALALTTLCNIEATLRTGAMQVYSTEGMLPSGEHAFFENRMVPCGPDQVLAIVRNVSQQKRIEDDLRTSEERYRVLAEHANEGIVVVQDGCVQYANPMAADITRYDRDKLLGIAFDLLVHPDDRRFVIDRHRRRNQGETAPAVYELRIVTRQGGTRWVEVNVVVISWEGKPATMIFFTDTTERRLVQQAHQLTQFTVEHARQPITVVDGSGAILFANEAARNLFGQDLQTRKIWDIDTSLSPKRWAQQWEEIKVKGSILFDTSLMVAGGAVLHFEVSSSFLQHNRLEYVVRYAHDVTERKQAAQTLSASEEIFRQLVEQSSEGVSIIDEAGYVIEWNRRQEELTGLSRHEVYGHPLWEIQYALASPEQRTPAAYERLQMMILQALQLGEAPWFHQKLVQAIHRPDGSRCTVETVTYPIRTRTGVIISSTMREVMPGAVQ